MPKKKKRFHRIKHHGKLFLLITSKLVLVFAAFLIGLYIGHFFSNPPILILIAFAIGIILYLVSILHIIKWLNIE